MVKSSTDEEIEPLESRPIQRVPMLEKWKTFGDDLI